MKLGVSRIKKGGVERIDQEEEQAPPASAAAAVEPIDPDAGAAHYG